MYISKASPPFFEHTNLIKYSIPTSLFTKYGIFQAKHYHDHTYYYLVMMHHTSLHQKRPIVYIHSQTHHTNHQIDIALKLIRKEGGAIIYYTKEESEIDNLLEVLKAHKLSSEENLMTKTAPKPLFTSYPQAYQTIGFILKNLSFSKLQLVSHDSTLETVINALDIEVVNKDSMIRFTYT